MGQQFDISSRRGGRGGGGELVIPASFWSRNLCYFPRHPRLDGNDEALAIAFHRDFLPNCLHFPQTDLPDSLNCIIMAYYINGSYGHPFVYLLFLYLLLLLLVILVFLFSSCDSFSSPSSSFHLPPFIPSFSFLPPPIPLPSLLVAGAGQEGTCEDRRGRGVVYPRSFLPLPPSPWMSPSPAQPPLSEPRKGTT